MHINMAPLDKKGVAAFQFPRNWHRLVTIKSLKMHNNTLSLGHSKL